ncbi:MAG: hypothetical protein OXF54_22990 [Caldilineaceae bacterium]|nr:hypothetical protein [Caldilineaceae bacterium]
MRMFGPSGNPHARNLVEVISCIQQHEGMQFEVKAVRSPAGSGCIEGNDELRTGQRG